MLPPLAQARPNLLNSNFRDYDLDDSSDYRYSTFDIPSNTVAMPNASKSNKAAAGKTGAQGRSAIEDVVAREYTIHMHKRVFVKVMTEDDGETAISDVERRLGRDHGYVSRYRSRLIVAGIIEPTRRGYVDFTIPYMREFVRENADRL